MGSGRPLNQAQRDLLARLAAAWPWGVRFGDESAAMGHHTTWRALCRRGLVVYVCMPIRVSAFRPYGSGGYHVEWSDLHLTQHSYRYMSAEGLEALMEKSAADAALRAMSMADTPDPEPN